MSNNHHRIFEKSECPSHQMLQDYLDGNLSAKDKHLVERHLIDCEMCADEVEGLSYMKDSSQLDEIVDEIKASTSDKKVKVIPFYKKYRIALAAAVFIILAGIVIVLQLTIDRQHQPIVAENTDIVSEESPKPEVSSDLKTESQEESSEINEEITSQDKSRKSPDIIMETVEEDLEHESVLDDAGMVTGVVAEDEPEISDDIIISEEVVSAEKNKSPQIIINSKDSESQTKGQVTTYTPQTESKGVADSKSIQETKITTADRVVKDNGYNNVTPATKEGKSEKQDRGKGTEIPASEVAEIQTINKEESVNLQAVSVQVASKISKTQSSKTLPIEKAMEKFNDKKYKASARLFEGVIESDSTNYKAVYYAAYSYYKLENIDKANLYLDKILSNKGNPYYTEAEALKRVTLKQD